MKCKRLVPIRSAMEGTVVLVPSANPPPGLSGNLSRPLSGLMTSVSGSLRPLRCLGWPFSGPEVRSWLSCRMCQGLKCGVGFFGAVIFEDIIS